MNKCKALLIPILFSLFIQPALANDDELYVAYTYESEAVGNILRDFGKTTGINIRYEYLGVDELKPKMMTMIESKNVLDAVIVPADNVGMYPFFKHSEISKNLFNTQIPDRIWANGFSDGKLYGAPIIQGNYLMLYYNKSLITEPAKDWESMQKQQAALAAKGVSTLVWHHNSSYLFLPFLDAFDGWPLNDGKVTLNTPGMVNALNFYKDLRINYNVAIDCNYICARKQFKSGKAAYILTGIWDAKELNEALGDNLGVAALPMLNGKKMISPFSTNVILFPNNGLAGSEQKELIQLVNYLQSTDVQKRLWDEAGAIPVEPTAFSYAQSNAKGYMKKALSLMQDTKPVPADTIMSFIWDAIYKGKTRHQAGGMTAEEAARYMQQLIERNQRVFTSEPQKPLQQH